MSIDAMRWAKRQKTGSASRKAVLMALADYADENGCAWPSQERIAEETEMTSRSVRSCIADLIELGLLTRKTKRNADGTRANDRLYLALDNGDRKQFPVADEPPEKSSGGRQPPENDDKTTGKSLPNHRKRFPGNPQYNNHQNGSDADASDTPAAPGVPIDRPIVDRLWTEGRDGLVGIGMTAKKAGDLIGRGLKATRDPQRVWVVVQATIRSRTGDPWSYAMRAFSQEPQAVSDPSLAHSKHGGLALLARKAGFTHGTGQHASSDDGYGAVIDHEGDGGSHGEVHECLGGGAERLQAQVYPIAAYAGRR